MYYLNIESPVYPYFIVAGTALYRPGDSHAKRSNIGVFDLIFIEYGELYITDANERYHLVQNDVLIIRPDSTHFGHQIVSQKSKFHWIHFAVPGTWYYSTHFDHSINSNSNNDFFNVTKTPIILPMYKKLTPVVAAEYSSIFAKLNTATINKYSQTETRLGNIPSPIMCQSMFLKILSYLEIFVPKLGRSELLAQNIMDFILKNYSTDISLDTIARYMNFHPAHIIRAVKAKYNTTPNKLITEVRISEAKKLLYMTDYSISKIAEFTGFNSSSYFCKTFQKMVGMTPNDFRKSKNHDNFDFSSSQII